MMLCLSRHAFLCVLVLLPLLAACRFWPLPTEADEGGILIHYGTSFGECIGYCITELTVEDGHATWVRNGWDRDMVEMPEIRVERDLSGEDWAILRSLARLDVLKSLQDVYGCPDCLDGGAEWVELAEEDQAKRVTIEYGETLQPVAGLLHELRALNESFLAQQPDLE